MSTGTISDVLARIGAIQQQIQQLDSGSLPGAGSGISGAGNGVSAVGASPAAADASSAFASALAQAGASVASAPSAVSAPSAAPAASPTVASQPAGGSTALGGTFDALTGGYGPSPVGATPGAGVALPASASTMLTSAQQQFASALAA